MRRVAAVVAVLLAVGATVAWAAPGDDGVDIVPARPYGPLPPSATEAPSGRAVPAVASTIAVPAVPADAVRAGVAKVDATWRVGAAAGQYAGDRVTEGVHQFDGSALSLRREPSYGIQSRSYVRAIVVEGIDGQRVAILANDLYVPQDLLNQRVSTILKEHDAAVAAGLRDGPMLGITDENMTIGVSHNHSSPYYSAMAWGVWAFQDVFDLRFFEFMADRHAEAIIAAVESMVPVRMGAATGPFDNTQRHSFGPALADDGTPAGYPRRDNDLSMSVLRFDDISDRARPRHLANLATLGQHPEFLQGNNLLSGEWANAALNMADVTTGAINVLLQNNTGTVEPDTNGQSHAPAVRAEYSHREYAQLERGARQVANSIVTISNGIGTGTPTRPDLYVPYSLDFPVAIVDRQFAPPQSHPYPSVSNCRTHEALSGNPGVPIVGLPDCERPAGDLGLDSVFGELEGTPLDPGVTYDTLQEAGIPLPQNYGAPSYTGLQETFQVHLQVIRLGDVVLTVCPCEQWGDQSRNIKSRADTIAGNQYLGWDWTELCEASGSEWICPDPRAVGDWDDDPSQPPADGTLTISDLAYRRIRAQVRNDADGWDDPDAIEEAEAEPADPALIRGNYTHTELAPEFGYELVVPIGMANDYWGYIATYREYQRGDHYRKALTGLGPHSSDWLATRLVAMAGALQGDPVSTALIQYGPLDQLYMVDGLHQEARAIALGNDGDVFLAAYEQTLPPDLGPPAPLVQPESITRFDVATFTWRGGSNYTDDPDVRVEREAAPGVWETAGDMTGEVVVFLDYADDPVTGLASYRTGIHEWRWTAYFEAFDSDIDTARGNQTPSGTYRFVVDGLARGGVPLAAQPYRVESAPFTIGPWDGITADGIRLEPDHRVSFAVGPVNTKAFDDDYPVGEQDLMVTVGPIDYPDSWPEAKLPTAPETGTTTFPRVERTLIAGEQRYCFSCTFRPWIDTGVVATAVVEITRASGAIEVVPATLGAGGRWFTTATLRPGDSARVAPAGITDTFGEINGQPSAIVSRPAADGAAGGGGGGVLARTGAEVPALALLVLLWAGLSGRRLARR